MKNSALLRSFKRMKNAAHLVLFFEFIHAMIFLFVGSWYVYKILPQFLHLQDAIDLLSTGAITSTSDLVLEVETMSATYTSFILWTIAVVLFLFINYTVIKYFVWKMIEQKKQTNKELKKSLLQFGLLNLLIFVTIIGLTYISYHLFVLDVFTIILFMIAPLALLYALAIHHPLFLKHQTVKNTCTTFAKTGIKRCYRFIIPCVSISIVFIVIMKILPLFLTLPQFLYFILYVFTFSLFSTWTKYYISETVKRAQS